MWIYCFFRKRCNWPTNEKAYNRYGFTLFVFIKYCKMFVAENKSEGKDIKLAGFCRKMDFFSLFSGKFNNFVCVLF